VVDREKTAQLASVLQIAEQLAEELQWQDIACRIRAAKNRAAREAKAITKFGPRHVERDIEIRRALNRAAKQRPAPEGAVTQRAEAKRRRRVSAP
jgi:hypothetical protein